MRGHGPGDRRVDADQRRAVRRSIPGALDLAEADLLETPVSAQAGSAGFCRPHVADEQNDSIRTLHSLSESTGGFAAVNRNDFAGAFERIVDESSSYYVVGYTPQRAAKPGEFRSIAVKVSRPGVSVSARNGYTGRAEAAVRRTVSEAGRASRRPASRCRRRAAAAARQSRSACRLADRQDARARPRRCRRCWRARCRSPGCRFAFRP